MTHRPDDKSRKDGVDGVLRSLTRARVPEGLEARVLDRLEARHAPLAAPAFWRRSELRWACAAMATVVALSAGWRVSHQRAASTSPRSGVATLYEPLRGPQTSPAPTQTVRPRQLASSAARPAARKLRRLAFPPAKSFPAPEAPLTHQEMLLLSAAHIHQPEVIDALDSTRRAALEAEDDREFKAYVASVPHGGF